MMDKGPGISTTLRLAAAITATAVPFTLLGLGVYGSFLFTFSVPLFWQVGILGKGVNSVGLKRRSFWPSAITGVLAGVLIAFAGGFILKTLGMTGYSMDRVHEMNSFFNAHHIRVSFRGEIGYRLLSAGDGLKEAVSYLGYCIFSVGLGEEIFWRGFIQRKISNVLPRTLSIWITAVLFGLVHVYIFLIIPFKEGLFMLGLITLAGVLWGYLYERFDNVWGPALSHGITAFLVWKYFVFSV